MTRKKSRKALVKLADKYFSEFIRKRDKKCIQCGTTQNLTCGHLFSRVAYSTRWDEENGWGQCASHNLRHEHDALPFTRVIEGILGREKVDALHRRFSTPRKFTNSELEEIINKYRGKE